MNLAAKWAGIGLGMMMGVQVGMAQTEKTLTVKGEFSGSASLVSDYRFRGLSQTFRDPAIQAGGEFAMPNKFYVGAWSSIVDKSQFTNSRGFEVDLYGGYRTEIGGGWTLDGGLIQYLYPTASSFSTLEAFIGAEWQFVTLKVNHTLSNKFFGVTNAKHSQYFDASIRYPLPMGLHLLGHYGIQRVHENSGDYSDYQIGIEKGWRDLTFTASIIGTDVEAETTNAAGRVVKLGGRALVLTVSKNF